MYHSITFDNGTETRNTWDDWYLIPSTRPTPAAPGIRLNLVTIPGRNGSLDFTDYLTGSPIRESRQGSFEFLVDNDHEDWIVIKNKILEFLHGKELKMILEDDPNFYYEGRFSLNDWKSESWNSKIVINYIVGPDKKHI